MDNKQPLKKRICRETNDKHAERTQRSSFTMPGVVIVTRRCLLDDVWCLRVANIKPSHPVTLVSRVEEDNIRYFAHAHYVSNDAGEVDVDKMAAQDGGTYTGIEPMGIIWSQKQEPGQKPGRRLVKSDVTTPIVTRVYALDGVVNEEDSLTQIENGSWLAYNTCDRLYMADGVERIPVSQGRLAATLFIPKGPGPFPGVLDLFGATIGVVEHRSALLASRGIASLALCFSSPTQHHGLVTDLEYFEEAVDYLLQHPTVQKPYIGAVGVSKGAEFVLLMGALFTDKIRACVSINGSMMPSLDIHTYKGESFKCLTQADVVDFMRFNAGETARLKNFNEWDEVGNVLKENTIPVERSKCEFLLVHGDDDHTVPPYMAEMIAARLESHGKRNYRILKYPGAGHLIEPPYSPHFQKTYHAMFGSLLDWGGECHQHAQAQESSWKEILQFIKETIKIANRTPTLSSL